MEDKTSEQVEAQDISPEGWDTPPTLRELKQDLTEAKTDHDDQVTKIDTWLDNLYVRGKAKPLQIKGRSSVQPKLIRKQAEWRYSALSEPFLASDELFSVSPMTWEDVDSAKQNQQMLNYQINTQTDKVRFIDSYVRAGVNEGTIIVKLAWEFEEREVERKKPVIQWTPDESMLPLFQEVMNFRAQNPTGYLYQVPEEVREAVTKFEEEQYPFRPTVTGYEMQPVLEVTKNSPVPEVLNYQNVIIDPSCGNDLSKANFVIHSFDTSMSELKQEGRYTNLEHINVEANSPLGTPDHETDGNSNFNFSDEARKRVVAHEYWGYWDIDGSGVVKPIVATWVGDTMIRLEASPYTSGDLPFVVVPLLPVKDSVYGEPDGELLEDNQKIMGAVTRGMIDIMGRSANAQMAYQKGALDATNKQRFQNGQDYEFNQGMDPRMAFYMHQYPEIPQSAQYMLNQQNADAESMSGVKAFSNGISSDALGEVATGIRGALDAASKRETGILRRLAAGIAEIGRKMVCMNSEFLEDEEIIRVTNEEFVAIRRDDLRGHFDLKVDVSSLEEDNVKAQELAFMLQTMGPNSDPMIAMKILTKIAHLRKMPDLAEEFDNYQPKPDPMQQQMQQLEMAKVQKEIQKIDAEIAEKMAGAQLDLAKASETQTKSDLNNLDFLEQESGTKQEREKELHGEQARANMELEAFKHGLSEKVKVGEQLQNYMNTRA